MNKKVKKEKEELSIKKIGESPVKNLGYFLIKGLFNKLGVKFHLDLLDKILPIANVLNLNIDNYF